MKAGRKFIYTAKRIKVTKLKSYTQAGIWADA
jgi:hypothetical protein